MAVAMPFSSLPGASESGDSRAEASWVNDFDRFNPASGMSLQKPGNSADAGPSVESLRSLHLTNPVKTSATEGTPQSTLEELEAEMKLLNWHKMANEAALKAALIRTKKLKASERPGKHPRESLEDKAEWMKQIIEEEQRKPLQVSKEFVREYQGHEQANDERLEVEVQRHISVLSKLRSQVEEREEMRRRKHTYKSKAKQLERDKRKIMAQGGAALRAEQEARGRTTEPKTTQRGNVKGTLSSVINSLDKLVDLEKRISTLENDSLYDKLSEKKQTPGMSRGPARRQRTELQFSKRVTPGSSRVPGQTVYSVRVAEKRRTGGARRGGGGSTFLTGVPEKSLREGGARTRGSRAAKPGATSSRLTARRGAGRQGARSESVGRRKTGGLGTNRLTGQSASQRKGAGGVRITQNSARARQSARERATVGKGASGARKYGSKHMQDFHELRGKMDKRKEAMRRNLRKEETRSAPSRLSRTTPTKLPAAYRRGGASVNAASKGRAGARATRSQTSSRTSGVRLSRTAGTGRMPAINGTRKHGTGGARGSLGVSGSRAGGSYPGRKATSGSSRLPTVTGTRGPGGRAIRQAW